MRKLLLGLLAVFVASSSAFAADRLLTCSKNNGNGYRVKFGICGVNGCVATVSRDHAKDVKYTVKRTKAADGALTYKTKTGATHPCTFKISALHAGVRKITNAPECATTLKNYPCVFSDPTA